MKRMHPSFSSVFFAIVNKYLICMLATYIYYVLLQKLYDDFNSQQESVSCFWAMLVMVQMS